MSTTSHNHNANSECPMCGTYLPSMGHLLSELQAAEDRLSDGDSSARQDVIAIQFSLDRDFPDHKEY